MKKIALLIFILPVFCCSYATEGDSLCILYSDSNRTIALDEVVVNGKKENENPSSTTDQRLSKIQGINLIKRSAYGLEPTLRGQSSAQILLTIDDMKIFGACTDKMDPVSIYIEPHNLDEINVKAGTQGSQNGSTGGGNIDMKMAGATSSSVATIKGKVGSGYQSISNGRDHYFILNYGSRKFATRVSGTYRKSNNYRNARGETVNFTQFEKTNISLNSKYLIAENDLISIDLLYDEGRDIGFAGLPMDVGKATAKIYAFNYKHYSPQSKGPEIHFKLYGNNIYHEMDDTKRSDVLMHMEMPGWTDTYGSILKSIFRSEKSVFELKLDGFINYSKAEMTMYPEGESIMYMLSWPGSRRENLGIYMNYDYQFDSSLTISLSLRMDQVKTWMVDTIGWQQWDIYSYNTRNPYYHQPKSVNLNLNKKFSPKLSFNTSVGFGERMPSISELFGFYLYNNLDGYDYLGNPDLNTEQNYQAEIGLNFMVKKWHIESALFFNHINNYMMGIYDSLKSPISSLEKGVKVYEHINYAQLYGGNLNIHLRLSEKISLHSNNQLTLGRDYSNTPLPQLAPLNNITSVQYQKKEWTLVLENVYCLSQNRINAQFGEDATPAYNIQNLKVSYKMKRLNLSLGIDNLSNQLYWDHLDWGNIYRPGRSFTLNAEFLF